MGLDEEKGKFRGAERRGDYRSPSMNGPGEEKAGHPRARSGCGGWGSGSDSGRHRPTRCGLALEAPLAAARASLLSLSPPSL